MRIRKGFFCSRTFVCLLRAKTKIFHSFLLVLIFYMLVQCPEVDFAHFVRQSFAKVQRCIAESLGYGEYGNSTEHLIPKYNQHVCDSSGDNRTSLADILRNHSPGPREICRCNGTHMFDVRRASADYAQSTCSIEATLRGSDQNVISFSLFLADDKEMSLSQLLDGVNKNLRLLPEIYPGWLMRVYTNVDFTHPVCSVVCSSEDIFFCDVRHLPDIDDATMRNILPMTWRHLPLGDPSVGKFLVRDLDSVINRREKAAVDEWLESGYPFHGMRDNPTHDAHIMGGLWGADNEKVCWNTAKDLQRRILAVNDLTTRLDPAMPDDMDVLAMIIYRSHEEKFLTHDSFYCEKYTNTIPFPTQRFAVMNFVGSSFLDPLPLAKFECPWACRPSYGKNWTMC